MGVVKALIEALADDLDNEAGLPEHQTIRKRRPRAIVPEDCPLLVVWLERTTRRGWTNMKQESNVSIGVSWHEESVDEAASLVDDETLSDKLIDAIELIEARVREIAREEITLAEGAWEITPGEGRYLPSDMQQGLTEGHAIVVEARVTEG
jgi:hypothetical protein